MNYKIKIILGCSKHSIYTNLYIFKARLQRYFDFKWVLKLFLSLPFFL